LEENFFSVNGKRVLDTACAWGGHAIAFAAKGAEVCAGDIIDHEFFRLSEFAREKGLSLQSFRSDCTTLPFSDGSFDIILALELVEHISSVSAFAQEVARVLKPGGLCLISTPSRLRSVIQGEPHYGIRGIAALPFFLQRSAASTLFGRTYPYPIRHQFCRASTVMRPFTNHALNGRAVITGRLERITRGRRLFSSLAKQYLWNFLIISKP
jgi:2-polyprenyl-3-methyl-5-hydroxy-6-metoxy-1,4-benzoquinol methylase